jgi:ketosteroid isomerase-like protein
MSTNRVALLLCLAGFLYGQPSPETQVRRLMDDFLTAFNNLDWQSFRQCWAADPVMFFPSLVQPTGRRTDDIAAFEDVWHRQFELIRNDAARRGVTEAPFQKIQPKDLRIDFPVPSAAVVTFHLGPANDMLGRRMFVLAKTDAGWKITHLHASNLSLSPSN